MLLGVEATVEGGIGRSIFLRGGTPTWMRSSSAHSPTAMSRCSVLSPTYQWHSDRLRFAAPGRTPVPSSTPHWILHRDLFPQKLTILFTSAFVSRSDDSDFLGGYDVNGGNSLLLPNRNLDPGFAKLDYRRELSTLDVARRLWTG